MSDSNQRNKPSCCSSFLHFIRTNALSKFLIEFAQKVKKEFTREKGLRLFLIFVGGIFMIINTLIGIVIPSSEVDCLSDKTLDLTAPLNTFFKKHNILSVGKKVKFCHLLTLLKRKINLTDCICSLACPKKYQARFI